MPLLRFDLTATQSLLFWAFSLPLGLGLEHNVRRRGESGCTGTSSSAVNQGKGKRGVVAKKPSVSAKRQLSTTNTTDGVRKRLVRQVILWYLRLVSIERRN